MQGDLNGARLGGVTLEYVAVVVLVVFVLGVKLVLGRGDK